MQTDMIPNVSSLRTYAPILWILAVITLVSSLICAHHNLSFMNWMTCWMAGLLFVFSLLKLFNIAGFAQDFRKYDLLAMRFPAYATAYPFIELALGCALILDIAPVATNSLILIVFLIGFIGVFQSVRRGENLQCACVGKLFDLPLSRVALVENGTMVLMSAVMITLSFSS